MPPPQHNAALTRVQRKSSEEYDGPGVGPEVWAGSVRALLDERRSRKPGGEAREVLRELIVATLDTPVAWRSGHVVTFTPDRGAETTATVQLVDGPDLAGVPPELRTTRLLLEAA